MNQVFKYIYSNVLPTRLRNSIDLFSSLRGGLNYPVYIEKPEGSRILVLSPHPDDDVYGCGGVLQKHHVAGDYIVSVYMTDGRKGGAGAEPEEEIIQERRIEAKKAAGIIGIDRLVFMDNEDSQLKPNKAVILQLRELIKEVQPDIVYLPFLIDHHPDHLATNDIFAEAIRKHKDFTCYGYEVWTPIYPNCFVDIGRYIDIKKLALKEFKTQTKRFNLVDSSLGLSKYRSVMLGCGDSFVESFFRCSPNEYFTLWELIRK